MVALKIGEVENDSDSYFQIQIKFSFQFCLGEKSFVDTPLVSEQDVGAFSLNRKLSSCTETISRDRHVIYRAENCFTVNSGDIS